GIMAAIAVHMVCGCCWHHAHASHAPLDSARAVEPTCPCDGYGHQHEGRPSDPAGSDSGSHEQGCDEGPCTFIRQGSSDSSDVLVDVYCIPLNARFTSLSAFSGMDTRNLDFGCFDEPVPLHLRHQVLLI
ncbi:MAG: hypothetical protein ACQESR_24705, partial [Planctomycetota bacterium]